MTEIERKVIQLPEICRVEGHCAVEVDMEGKSVKEVRLSVFEGTRFFERIVLDHKFDEMPHITSRVCAICSTGHVIAAARAIERVFGHAVSHAVELHRELMQLGMIIESHATHVCALALPDFLKTPDLFDFATAHKPEFDIWTHLRKLGARVQTAVGGRPFHPINLHVGGLSRYPEAKELRAIKDELANSLDMAIHLCRVLLKVELPVEKTCDATYMALIPSHSHYGYFGDTVKSSDGWESDVSEYREYLGESVVAHSHAKRSKAKGKLMMVGSMARLHFFSERLGKTAYALFAESPLARGDKNTILNNLAQSIEIVEAIERAQKCIDEILALSLAPADASRELEKLQPRAGRGVGAVECPRGTLYHSYELDETGKIVAADMITPSAQNTAKIESDIRTIIEDEPQLVSSASLQEVLETLVRAYDPCNTCATHMVEVKYLDVPAKS